MTIDSGSCAILPSLSLASEASEVSGVSGLGTAACLRDSLLGVAFFLLGATAFLFVRGRFFAGGFSTHRTPVNQNEKKTLRQATHCANIEPNLLFLRRNFADIFAVRGEWEERVLIAV
jgi:hypothetical protein